MATFYSASFLRHEDVLYYRVTVPTPSSHSLALKSWVSSADFWACPERGRDVVNHWKTLLVICHIVPTSEKDHEKILMLTHQYIYLEAAPEVEFPESETPDSLKITLRLGPSIEKDGNHLTKVLL